MKNRNTALIYKQRQKQCLKSLSFHNISSLLLLGTENLRYFTGYDGYWGAALLHKDNCDFFTDHAHCEDAIRSVKAANICILNNEYIDEIKSVIFRNRIKSIGYLASEIKGYDYLILKSDLIDVNLFPADRIVSMLRSIKDKNEVKLIKKASSINDEIFNTLSIGNYPVLRESFLSAKIVYHLIKSGSKEAFPTQVISGCRTSRPHAETSVKKINAGDLVICDFGAKWKGYCSDCTRTFIRGRASARKRRLYRIVLSVSNQVITKIKPGIFCSDLYDFSMNKFAEFGLSEYFCHVLGHGVGLSVHEYPVLSGDNRQEIKPGMVLAVEPGIYIPGWGGIRIEDLVLVTKNGVKILSKFEREYLKNI